MTALRRKRVWAVHQLDKQTSGLNLFVTRKALVDVWMRRLRGTPGAKRYLAIVHGALTSPLTVDAPLGRVRRPDGREVPAVTAAGRPSKTRLIPHASTGAFSLVEARPATGRTHQVRLHLGHVGHPLVGEPFHRDPPCALHPRQALHAWVLDFGPQVARFEAPLPADLLALLTELGLDWPG